LAKDWLIFACSEGQLAAHSVDKQLFSGVESVALDAARAPFLSRFARVLRCRKDLCQFVEVLGCRGEDHFVICASWAA
jgi:hypothetical protein